MRRASPNAMVQNEDEHRPSYRPQPAPPKHCIRRGDEYRPLLPPPPAHSRLVFKSSSLKGKQW